MASNPGFTSVLSSRAQKEISESWEWYEERQQGLGDRFVKEVTNRIREIERNPERYPNRFRTYRETTVKTFPYIIIYRVNKRQKSVRVISVFHTARKPGKKYS